MASPHVASASSQNRFDVIFEFPIGRALWNRYRNGSLRLEFNSLGAFANCYQSGRSSLLGPQYPQPMGLLDQFGHLGILDRECQT